MNPSQIYQQQQDRNLTRIDLLLSLYNKAIGQLQQAQQALERHDRPTASLPLFQAQVLVYALATGVDPKDGEVPQNLHRLYEFVLHCLSLGEVEKIEAARRVLTILRDGLDEVAPKARKLELSGKLPAFKQQPALQITA